MPIKFRCRHCRQFLGISRAQAGEITNCPQCGKAIRVPELDGTVAPIPAPKLNFKDAQLADALSELALLESNDNRSQAIDPSQAPQSIKSRDVAPVRPPVEVVAPAATVLVAPMVQRAATVDTAQGTAVEEGTHDALRSLAESVRAPQPLTLPTPVQSPVWKMAIPVAGATMLLAVAWFLMGRRTPDSNASPLEGDPASAATVTDGDSAPAQAASSDHPPALTGRITYLSDSGDTQPDSGAVVMLLPRPRTGQVKLDSTGFLAGADTIDVQTAAAALRVLGGDVTSADDDGRYQLSVTSGGDYQLLVISHHQPREPSRPIETRVQETLSDYFFRPSSLLGQLAFQFDDFHYRGQGTSPRDISFATE